MVIVTIHNCPMSSSARAYALAACSVVHFTPVWYQTSVDAYIAYYSPSHLQEKREYVFLIYGYVSSTELNAYDDRLFCMLH